MIKVTVIYLPPFLLLTEKREEEVSLKKGETINHLTNKLAQKYGEEFRNLAGQGETYPAVVFLKEGKTARLKRDTVLNEGDRIIMAMPVGGG